MLDYVEDNTIEDYQVKSIFPSLLLNFVFNSSCFFSTTRSAFIAFHFPNFKSHAKQSFPSTYIRTTERQRLGISFFFRKVKVEIFFLVGSGHCYVEIRQRKFLPRNPRFPQALLSPFAPRIKLSALIKEGGKAEKRRRRELPPSFPSSLLPQRKKETSEEGGEIQSYNFTFSPLPPSEKCVCVCGVVVV